MNSKLSSALVLATVILMDVLAGAEVDLFIPSFPELQEQFGLTPFWVEALLSSNFIGYCLSLFFVGALADRYGRRPVITLGLIIFILGSISCLFAPSYNFLLAGRFLQGIGIAAPATLCFIIVADAYPLKQQQFLMAMLNGVANASVGLAPVIGSYVTLYFHWQGNFTALLILGLVVLLMTRLFIPVQKLPEVKETLSIKGYYPIFTTPSLMLILVNIICVASTYWIFIGMSPLLYIEDLGVSLEHFGYYQGAMAMVFAFGSILAGFIISKLDQYKMLYYSTLFCLLSFFIMLWITLIDCNNPLYITLAVLPYSISCVLPIVILYPIALHILPQAKARVSAVMQGARLILTAVGLQIAGFFYTGSFQNIGIVMTSIFFVGVLTLILILKNRQLKNLTAPTQS